VPKQIDRSSRAKTLDMFFFVKRVKRADSMTVYSSLSYRAMQKGFAVYNMFACLIFPSPSTLNKLVYIELRCSYGRQCPSTRWLHCIKVFLW